MTQSSRRPLIVGNWKMHTSAQQAQTLAQTIIDQARIGPRTDVAVAPPYVHLASIGLLLRGSRVVLSAQNVHWEAQGAYTGEISPVMLSELGCTYCIIGHSERRQYFAETDDNVHKKAAALLKAKITPIVCVGETLSERESGQTFEVVRRQLDAVCGKLDPVQTAAIVVAYEPVWAIGTGRTARADDAQLVHAFLRDRVRHLHGEPADAIRILYGGSVKAENAAELLAQPDIDGALVGGASLDAKSFIGIIQAAG